MESILTNLLMEGRESNVVCAKYLKCQISREAAEKDSRKEIITNTSHLFRFEDENDEGSPKRERKVRFRDEEDGETVTNKTEVSLLR